MTFNYRIIEKNTKPEKTLGIHTVYYAGGEPVYWSHEPVPMVWSEGENQREMCDQILEAFRKPVINADDLVRTAGPF